MTAAMALVLAPAALAGPGTWERAWGKDVVTGGNPGFEACTVASGCKAGTSGALGGELNTPAAVATAPGGAVYVADAFNHRIVKYDASGGFDRAWGKDVVTGGGTGFEVCTVASSCQAGDPTGFGRGGELDQPSGVATDPAGNVFVADTGNSRIQKFSSAGTFLRTWGKDVFTGGGTGFEICAVAADCTVGSGGALGGELAEPSGIAVAQDETGLLRLYVADASNRRIDKFNADPGGTFLAAWGKDVVTGGGTGYEVCTVAADCKRGEVGGLGGELNRPVDVATSGVGLVYVADQFNARIQSFTTTGAFQRAWGKDVVTGGGTGFEVCTVASSCKAGPILGGGLGGELNMPRGVATDPVTNAVYVADGGNERVQMFDWEGSFDRAWGKDVVTGGDTGFEICTVAADCKQGTIGGFGGELNSPGALAADAGSNVYVADAGNVRIQKFEDPVEPPTITDTNPDSPANDNNPEVKGTVGGGNPTQVRIYKNATCDGTPAVTSSVVAFTYSASLGVTVPVSDDQTTTLSARVLNEAGAESACSNAFSYIEDSTAPAAPTITGTDPGSPANDNNPEVKGTAEAGSTVRLYESSSCSGPVEAQGSAASFSSPGLTAAVTDDQEIRFSATATDAAGNTSSCAGRFPYIEDSTAPAAPTITDTDPDSPANDNNPEVKGTVGGGSPTEVKIYLSASCAGSPVSTDSIATFTGTGITAAVADDQAVRFTARATDQAGNHSACSNAIDYVEDSTGPAAPTITGTDPGSPANDNNPEVKGTVGGGTPTQVKIYLGADCAGSPVSTDSIATFTGAGITVAVADDQAVQFSASANDQVGNESACSNAFSYIEDSTAPAAPTITGTDPGSPANDNNPEVKGTAEAGSTVKLYKSSSCSGPVEAQGSAASFASPGLSAAIADDQVTQFSATATDAAGITSACSNAIDYIEDSTAPETTITKGPKKRSKRRKATFKFGSSAPGLGFECTIDGRALGPCTSPMKLKVKRRKHLFSVVASDSAGNTDPTPATYRWTVKKKKTRR